MLLAFSNMGSYTKEEGLELESRICQILSSAKLFNKQTMKINELYKKATGGQNVLSIHSNLYFGYVLSVFRTLFEKDCNPQEQSFALWRKMKGDIAGEKENFRKIIELYEKSNFKTFRDKITDHKDHKNAGDAIANFLNPIKGEHIDRASEIILMLEGHVKEYFDDSDLHDFYNFYSVPLNDFSKFLEEKYTSQTSKVNKQDYDFF